MVDAAPLRGWLTNGKEPENGIYRAFTRPATRVLEIGMEEWKNRYDK